MFTGIRLCIQLSLRFASVFSVHVFKFAAYCIDFKAQSGRSTLIVSSVFQKSLSTTTQHMHNVIEYCVLLHILNIDLL